MALDKRNDAASSQAPAKERTARTTRRQRLTTSTGTLSPPSLPGDSLYAPSPLPTLPFDILLEILQRLPVKSVFRFRCVCKSFNSLISDPKFAKKHLRVSTTRHRYHLIVSSTNSSSSRKFLLWDSPISSVFNALSSTSAMPQTQLTYPSTINNKQHHLFPSTLAFCSCDGILCFPIDQRFALLWNPSIRKFKKLPPLEIENPQYAYTVYSFGYYNFTDNYKVVAVFFVDYKTQVSIHTLGTDSWRRIQEFPYGSPTYEPGIFVSGTVNWLAFAASSSWPVIVSLDLGKECYQEILQPDYGVVEDMLTLSLGVLRDCLCIFSHSDTFLDIWFMKDYGKKESWTKLFTIPYTVDLGFLRKVLYISEDQQVLLESRSRLVVYDSKTSTFKIPKVRNINGWVAPEVYVESLVGVSPCS